MRRRTFIQSGAIAAAARLESLAAAPMPVATLGRTGLKVSRIVVGGYHMAVQGEEMATRIIHQAVELGVNFFDSANLYHRGLSDEIYGRALAGGLRQKVMLMTKCENYSRDGSMKMLEEQLRRMKTDYLDLWQVHQVSELSEAEQVLGPNGSLETFVKAKKEGKVRHIGFTGHRDPQVHLKLLNGTSEWETVQMPINLIDPHYLSFIETVLPVAREKGLGVLAMKSNAMGAIGRNNGARELSVFAEARQDDGLASSGHVCHVPALGEEQASLLLVVLHRLLLWRGCSIQPRPADDRGLIAWASLSLRTAPGDAPAATGPAWRRGSSLSR